MFQSFLISFVKSNNKYQSLQNDLLEIRQLHQSEKENLIKNLKDELELRQQGYIDEIQSLRREIAELRRINHV